ncbi:hypothetical protein TNCV_3505831 [Trichonephila clavipes]|uniref:Uncharacterized protein n=1 Tax=Trichonephila clavipes TaxID=2585209 RepID=A0A8X6S914_TRICX|nr:hypothetical protein TNCV_3505831 [Trichonephila clavipes]
MPSEHRGMYPKKGPLKNVRAPENVEQVRVPFQTIGVQERKWVPVQVSFSSFARGSELQGASPIALLFFIVRR